MRVVFMGTPDISAACLKKILADGFEVVGIYTQPDRPKGRGMKLVPSPVKEIALAEGIPVFQPENFKSDEAVAELAALKPDVCAVVAYGRILPQRVLDIPTKGCINIHTSLLPAYRGSAPYQWAVLDGLTETGVSCMYLSAVGIYTQPDRPKGRGMKLVPSPVKEIALAEGIPVFQPENFKSDEAVAELAALKPDVCAVVAYGRILPQRVLDIPTKGCINIHTSLLPAYRGSAPYQWAVLDGLTETGVSCMYLSAGMDAGDIIDVAKTPIGENETAGELLDRLAVLGADLLSKSLGRMSQGEVEATAQDEALVTYAPMLDKTMCPIDWSKSAQAIHNQVRGLHPWPVATATIGGTDFKIHQTVLVNDTTGKAPGTPLELNKKGLKIACGGGTVLEIRQLQAQGGKRMAAPDYFRGHPLEI